MSRVRFVPRTLALSLALCALASLPRAIAQQAPGPPPKKPPAKGQTVEIRGQAPTPQVVTVRPREVPQFAPSGVTATMMASGALTSIVAGYSLSPANQVAGRLPLDTSAAGIARGGTLLTAPEAAAAAAAAAGNASLAPGASASEIEAMRRELAMRRARLDSLEAALRDNEAAMSTLGPSPDVQHGLPPGMTAAEAAARAKEIEAIRRELSYRRVRLDSLQKEVNSMGRPSDSDSTSTPPR